MEKKYGKLGLIGRWKPLHNGSFSLLETSCRLSDNVIIGIGSSNKNLSMRNPFSAKESEEMIMYSLHEHNNYNLIHIPDFKDGKKWAGHVYQCFGSLDGFVSGNPYVINLLHEYYNIMLPSQIIPEPCRHFVKSTFIKHRIAAMDSSWKDYVPKEVAEYLESNDLIKRFRNLFGKQTIEYINSNPSSLLFENIESERRIIE